MQPHRNRACGIKPRRGPGMFIHLLLSLAVHSSAQGTATSRRAGYDYPGSGRSPFDSAFQLRRRPSGRRPTHGCSGACPRTWHFAATLQPSSGLGDSNDDCRGAVIATGSGDSSVVTRWTVDQEVVGSNSTHAGNLISVVRSLSEFTQPIR